ncbi:MAG: type VII secretion-associated protein [Pseudonocardia sp.]|nr:type VII secretion-associated protein [Pseudonocardia sp.]
MRVAVDVGRTGTRVAGAGPGEVPRLLGVLPAGTSVPAAVGLLVAGAPQDVLVLGTSLPRAVAATGGRPGVRLVVDAGEGGTTLSVVDGPRVLREQRLPIGGGFLDDVVGAALAREVGSGPAGPGSTRAIREALSLRPEVRLRAGEARVRVRAGTVREALAEPLVGLVHRARGAAAEVLLIGGLARTPLLAELFDEAGFDRVVVAERPDVAAVLGALAVPRPVPPVPAEPEERVRLPPVPDGSTRRRLVLAAGALAVAAGLLGIGQVLPAPEVPAAPADLLVQYGYALPLPDGWEHTGGEPGRRRVLLTPWDAPDGAELISVERAPLGYDAEREPERARAELRAAYDDALAAGERLEDLDPDARSAGRPVVRFRQVVSGGAARVDWFVVLDGTDQLSVGCRYAGAAPEAACTEVVGGVRGVG